MIKLLTASFLMFVNLSLQNTEKYMKPGDFTEIPKTIKLAGISGCLIPRPWKDETRKVNVFSGEFGQQKGQDLVIVCSRNGYSQTFIFWNSRPDKYSIIDEQIDSFSDDVGGLNETIWYKISKRNVRKYWFNCDKKELPRHIKNDGIVYYTFDKGGLAYYYHKGKFITCATD